MTGYINAWHVFEFFFFFLSNQARENSITISGLGALHDKKKCCDSSKNNFSYRFYKHEIES